MKTVALNHYIGQNIRAARLKQGITLRSLAARMNVLSSKLALAEEGREELSPYELHRAASFLEVRISDLLENGGNT